MSVYNFFNLQNEDGVSIQDRLMAGMSREQIREFRQNAVRQALTGRYASTHNARHDELVQSIHLGERLTDKSYKS